MALEAYDWLRARGIKNWTISKWRLGVVLRPLPGHEKFMGQVTLPYLDSRKKERGMRFRRLDGHKPKYDGTLLKGSHIFGVKYSSEPQVFIVTGEFNTMILHQMGFKAVGVPGDNTWRPEWRWLFRGCEEIGVVPDPDGEEPSKETIGKGGALFRVRVMHSLKGLPVFIRYVKLPEGYDVNELYLEDRQELRRLLKGG